MRQRLARPLSALLGGAVLCLAGSHAGDAQQTPLRRTDLLTTTLPDMGGKDMHVWVADIAPGAATPRHTHPTPRFVYVLEGSVVVEFDGKPLHTYSTGEAFEEPPGMTHIFRNASNTAPARALGFQYSAKEQPLQVDAH